ncbi:MAG: hypothetical protein JXR46_11385 [Calditrichaceae bacterium]|nr:hypothetical protein [Calditrichaceae bacterium]MBN2709637.1 hypothetical protein [Calditrichaceae bacterium]RQV92432.1 MAG: hypothetical protein EH224_15650 [Calditrichota bacterium]
MPLSFKINQKSNYIYCRYIGKINDEELFNSWKAFYESDAWVPGMNELSDLTEGDASEITAEGIKHIARYARSIHEKHNIHFVKIALVAPETLNYGLSRMYAGLTSGSAENVRVFKSKFEADAWLRGIIEE